MELVEKWEIEGNIHDGNRNTINRYFDLFKEYIAPIVKHSDSSCGT